MTAFADAFHFSRARSAPYLDATGAAALAPPDTPRFDHQISGQPRGLLVQGLMERVAPDVITLSAAQIALIGTGRFTILHEYERPNGEIVAHGGYATQPAAVVAALLSAEGWHRRLIVVPTYLANKGGYVLFRGRRWALRRAVAANPTHVVAAGGGAILVDG